MLKPSLNRLLIGRSLACVLAVMFCHSLFGQELQPGLEGMSPSKWITIKNTHAPRSIYKTANGNQVYSREDFFFKIWLPVVRTDRFTLAVAPQYRTEQLEMENYGENSMRNLDGWNLRSAGIDVRALTKVGTSSWVVSNLHVNKSGNFSQFRFSAFPYNYTVSNAFIKKVSENKEWGFGLLLNRSNSTVTVLPIFIFHYNFSQRTGIEISIPYKVAWRFNPTPRDIFYVKTEAFNRSYFIMQENSISSAYRRIDIDMGVAYNRQVNKLVGFEVFGGYKQNLVNLTPPGSTAVRTSGLTFSAEVYIRPPFKGKR